MELEYLDNCGGTPCMHKNTKLLLTPKVHHVCIKQEYFDRFGRQFLNEIGIF